MPTITVNKVINFRQMQSKMKLILLASLLFNIVPTTIGESRHIFTYYDPKTVIDAKEQQDSIRLWLRNWYARGYLPHVLGPTEARMHPQYVELAEIFAKFPTINDPSWEMSQYVQWIAFAKEADYILREDPGATISIGGPDIYGIGRHIEGSFAKETIQEAIKSEPLPPDSNKHIHSYSSLFPAWMEVKNSWPLNQIILRNLANYTVNKRRDIVWFGDNARRHVSAELILKGLDFVQHLPHSPPGLPQATIIRSNQISNIKSDEASSNKTISWQKPRSKMELANLFLLDNLHSVQGGIAVLSPYPNHVLEAILQICSCTDIIMYERSHMSVAKNLSADLMPKCQEVLLLPDAADLLLHPPSADSSRQKILLLLPDPVKLAWKRGKLSSFLFERLFPRNLNSSIRNLLDKDKTAAKALEELPEGKIDVEKHLFWLLNHPNVAIIMINECPEDIVLSLEYHLGIRLPIYDSNAGLDNLHGDQNLYWMHSRKQFLSYINSMPPGDSTIDPQWRHSFENNNVDDMRLYQMAKKIWQITLEEIKSIEDQMYDS